MNNTATIPSYVHHALWSYDIAALDLQRDQRDIITQLLNRGGARAVHWLRQIYGDAAIAAVVRNPPRGRWFPQVLNFWVTIYNIVLDPTVLQRAIITLYPTK